MKCWNCDDTLLILPYWRMVQCTQCKKVNRIPGNGVFDEKDENKVGKMTYKDKTNDVVFDIMFPVTVSF